MAAVPDNGTMDEETTVSVIYGMMSWKVLADGR